MCVKKQIGKREVNERHKEKKSAEMLRLKWRDETPYLPPPPHLLAGQRGGVSFKRGRKVISPPLHTHTCTHTISTLTSLFSSLFNSSTQQFLKLFVPPYNPTSL